MTYWRKNATSNKIRRIADLFKHTEPIYIYLANKRIGKQFLQNADEEGFRFDDGVKPTEREWSDIFAIHKNKTVCYVGFAGRMAFGCNAVTGIDYERYLNGEKNYLYRNYRR